MLPETMLAIAVPAPGGPEALVPERRPLPRPGPGQLLLRVAAAGVNRPDVVQRQGHYPPPPGAPDIPGLEVAGTVAALGEGAARFGPRDALCALVAGGGYAEYCVVDEALALPIPGGLGAAEAAALPETAFTVWSNVFERGRLAAGESLLVHGGTSGIGTLAIQLAAARGARVFATAGSEAKCDACRGLGAEVAVNYKAADFVEAVREATGGRGVDVILDMVGGDYVARNYRAAAMDGRIVQIAFLEGAKTTLDLRPLMTKRLVHTGSTLRPRPLAEKAALARAVEAEVWPLVAAGRVRPVMDRAFPLAEATAAHRRMESSAHVGKIVLVP